MTDETLLEAVPVDVRVRRATAQARANSWDEKTRTIQVVAATETPVMERGPSGLYYEVLTFGPDSIDATRLDGMSVLNSHRSGDLRDHIGVVVRHWIENNQLILEIRLSDRADNADIVRAIIAGDIQWVSIGYRPIERKARAAIDGKPAMNVTRWEPREISFVSVPADPMARVRTSELETADLQSAFRAAILSITETGIAQKEHRPMTDSVDTGESKPEVKAVETAVERTVERAVETKTEAIDFAAYETVARGAKLGKDAVLDAVKRGISPADWGMEILNERARIDQETHISSIHVSRDAGDTFIQGLGEYFDVRSDVKGAKLDKGDRFRGMTLLEVSREILSEAGVKVRGLGPYHIAEQLFTRSSGMLNTGDFSNLLANTASKTLRQAYEEMPRTFTKWAKGVTLPNFKSVSRVALANAPGLVEVVEGDEYNYGTMSDKVESYALKTYGVLFALTRQAIINDDLSGFSRIPQSFGAAAASKESDIVYAILSANAALSDSVALFHATHANLGTAGVISSTSIAEAFQKLRNQTGIEGRYLNLQPSYLVCGPAYEATAKKELTGVIANATSGVNIFANSLEIVVDPRITGNAWYVMAAPSMVDTIEYAHLAGQEAVYVERRDGWSVDGVEFKARLDFAAKAIDYRGMVKNAGA